MIRYVLEEQLDKIKKIRECNVCRAYEMLKEGITKFGFETRAEGEAEFKPARLQIKRVNEEWEKGWLYTYDLAGTLGALGFDDNELNEKRRDLLNSIVEELKRGNLYSVYPGSDFTHRRLIWEEGQSIVLSPAYQSDFLCWSMFKDDLEASPRVRAFLQKLKIHAGKELISDKASGVTWRGVIDSGTRQALKDYAKAKYQKSIERFPDGSGYGVLAAKSILKILGEVE